VNLNSRNRGIWTFIFPLLLSFFIFGADLAFARSKSGRPTYVKGHYTKKGTWVKPHYRSAPDGDFSNNWSTRGNRNPYTGKIGTKTSPGYSSYRSDAAPSGNGDYSGTTNNGVVVSGHYRAKEQNASRGMQGRKEILNFLRCTGVDGQSWYTNGLCRENFNLM